MGLDAGFALEYIRPYGTLCQELNPIEFACFICENFNEFSTDNMALFFRIRDAFEIGKDVSRATFAVCAVNGDGAESDRSTVSYVRTE